MRLLYRLNGKWVQLFTDCTLQSGKYLEEFYDPDDDTDAARARANLRIPDNYWSKAELASPVYEDYSTAYHAVSPNVINENPSKRFVSDEEMKKWDNKVDRPLTGSSVPVSNKIDGEERNITEGRIWYDNTNDTVSIILNTTGDSTNSSIIYRAPDNYRFTAGTSSFNGPSGRVITHGCKNALGTSVTPIHISITPVGATNGLLGEYYVTDITSTTFNVYNTGSGRTSFSWSALFMTGTANSVVR